MHSPTWNIYDDSPDIDSMVYDSLDGGKGIINQNCMCFQTTLGPGIIEVHMKGGAIEKFVHVGGII